MKGLLFACGLLATMASAHIQMIDPIPIRSPESKDKSGKIDYSYTNPLSDSGSDYPCKGYADDPFKSVADYSPGQQYSLKLKGSATHEGGSCQISLSYDKGKSFKVIHSMLGGCPITQEYQFQIPQGAPSGEALLAWTWFNKVGNREMYMNCAQVTIGGGGAGNGGQRKGGEEKAIARRDGLEGLPPMFIANVNGPGKCKTIEGEDVNFPMPGESVEGQASGKGYKCEGSAPFLGDGGSSKAPNTNKNNGGDGNGGNKNNDNKGKNDNKSNKGNNGNNDNKNDTGNKNNNDKKNNDNKNNGNKNNNADANGSNQKDKSSSNATARKELVHKVPMPFGDNVKNGDMRTASAGTQNSPSWLAAAEGCNGNGVICAPDGQTWALCNDGKPVHMGNVAAGTTCSHGAMQHAAMEPAA
ncbi:hypothetical protein BJX96DRAFT_184052 [Aspergillus floccosus]